MTAPDVPETPGREALRQRIAAAVASAWVDMSPRFVWCDDKDCGDHENHVRPGVLPLHYRAADLVLAALAAPVSPEEPTTDGNGG
jgi:hypothetical protein